VNRCSVANCDFIAESVIEDFAVCALHDHAATRRILDDLQRPGAYWMSGHPIVMPCGPLEEKHLVPIPARPGNVRAGDATDHLMTNIPDGPAPCHPAYDLSL
jgi:hypothetical protein